MFSPLGSDWWCFVHAADAEPGIANSARIAAIANKSDFLIFLSLDEPQAVPMIAPGFRCDGYSQEVMKSTELDVEVLQRGFPTASQPEKPCIRLDVKTKASADLRGLGFVTAKDAFGRAALCHLSGRVLTAYLPLRGVLPRRRL